MVPSFSLDPPLFDGCDAIYGKVEGAKTSTPPKTKHLELLHNKYILIMRMFIKRTSSPITVLGDNIVFASKIYVYFNMGRGDLQYTCSTNSYPTYINCFTHNGLLDIVSQIFRLMVSL